MGPCSQTRRAATGMHSLAAVRVWPADACPTARAGCHMHRRPPTLHRVWNPACRQPRAAAGLQSTGHIQMPRSHCPTATPDWDPAGQQGTAATSAPRNRTMVFCSVPDPFPSLSQETLGPPRQNPWGKKGLHTGQTPRLSPVKRTSRGKQAREPTAACPPRRLQGLTGELLQDVHKSWAAVMQPFPDLIFLPLCIGLKSSCMQVYPPHQYCL